MVIPALRDESYASLMFADYKIINALISSGSSWNNFNIWRCDSIYGPPFYFGQKYQGYKAELDITSTFKDLTMWMIFFFKETGKTREGAGLYFKAVIDYQKH